MIIIPARYGSTRFPGKPLIDIAGTSMIKRVYNQCLVTGQRCIVATDDERIYDHVKQFGAEVYMTNTNHASGTDRCSEVYQILGCPDEVVVNVQGDEPFIRSEQILSLIGLFNNPAVEIATLYKQINDSEELHSKHVVKITKENSGRALYFSRQAIPFMRDELFENWHLKHKYYKHIGVYAFRGGLLSELAKLKASSLELAESLEQLRWLENGYKIYTTETLFQSPAIDTPEDLKNVLLSYIKNE